MDPSPLGFPACCSRSEKPKFILHGNEKSDAIILTQSADSLLAMKYIVHPQHELSTSMIFSTECCGARKNIHDDIHYMQD